MSVHADNCETIIECLKYATTGLLPPNTGKGAAFIHDPKVCPADTGFYHANYVQLTGEKEVKAQVKLGFRSVAGHQMTATRNMQVSSKKAGATPSMATIDCTLLIRKDGERTVVSSKGKQPRLPWSHPTFSADHPKSFCGYCSVVRTCVRQTTCCYSLS